MYLKIKDNVDLEELKKYGFKKIGDFYIREYEEPDVINYYKKHYIRIRNLPKYAYYKEIWDCAEDRLGFVHTNYDNVGIYNKIQDLIEADLIEMPEGWIWT